MDEPPILSAEEAKYVIELGHMLTQKVQQLEEELKHKDEAIVSLNQQIELHINDKRQYARTTFQRSMSSSPITNLPHMLLPSETDEVKHSPRDVNRSPKASDHWHISQLKTELERAQEELELSKKNNDECEAKIAKMQEEVVHQNRELEVSRDREERLQEQLADAETSIVLAVDKKRKQSRVIKTMQEEIKKIREEQTGETVVECRVDSHARLNMENIALQNSVADLQRILSETRSELQELKQKTSSSPAKIVQEKKEESFSDEWNQLLREKFEQSLQVLMEQISHNERRNKFSNPSSPRNGGQPEKIKASYFEDYFAMLVLTIKVLLSKEERYRHVWHNIWFEDKNEIYEQCLNEDIEVHNWWIFIFSTIQQRLEDAIEEMYTNFDTQGLRTL
jgi:hypothetical protein